MMRNVTMRVAHKFAELKRESKVINRMAEKIDVMNKTMIETTPKMFTFLIMASTIPTFYYGYQLVTQAYNHPQYVSSAHAALLYINIKNVAIYSCILLLSHLKFNAPTAQFTLPNRGFIGKIAPLALSLVALALPPSDNKFIVLPTFMADVSTLVLEAQMANYGTYPFWLYSCRHYIRFFEWVVIGITFFALKNYRNRMKSHPHEFVIEVPEQPITADPPQQTIPE